MMHNEQDRGDSVLSVRDLYKDFGENSVLKGMSLSVGEGEVVALVGPNGSGKSTLLSCIVGTERADDGEVHFRGRLLDEASSLVRASIAALLDDVDFFPDLSVAEHLSLYAWSHGQPSADKVVDNVLDELALTSAKDQLPATLSSGQKHRLGLASCFVRPRELIVLDEPEQRLDKAGQQWLARRLNQERNSGVAVIMATHDLSLADTVADRVVEVW